MEIKLLIFLKLQKEYISKKFFWIYILLAYIIVFFIKLILFFQIKTFDISPLWGSDGGLYGYYAKEILQGNIKNYTQDLVPALPLVFVVKYLHISLDNAIYFLPIFLSSLSIIPIIYMGYIYKQIKLSFLAAIFGSITYSYYTRSYLGYFDTDCLNIFFTYMIIAFLIAFVEKKEYKYLIFAIFISFIFLIWYHSSKIIIFAIFLNFLAYIIINKKKYYFFIGLLVGVLVLYLFDSSIFHRVVEYIDKKENIEFISHNSKLLFKSTLSTVSEAKPLALKKLGKYLSINNLLLIISLVFTIFIYKQRKSFLLTLPILFLTILSLKGGIRFAEYGSYLIAFGLSYFLFVIKNINKVLFFLILIVIFYYFLDVVFKKNKRLHPIFSYESVKVLRKLDKKLSKNDFILTWWDYGWPLWYYTKANTLIDNGKHFEDNYIISKLLFLPQEKTYIYSKYLINKCHTRRCYLSQKIFANQTPFEFEKSIKDIKLDDKNIYFFFHERMIEIAKVILSFSNRDLISGKRLKNGILKLYRYPYYKDKKTSLHKIIYKNRYVILCDDTIYNSFFIQVFLLNNFDKTKFKLVGESNEIKIYKIL